MKKKRALLTIKKKLLAAFLLLALVPAIFIGTMSYLNGTKAVENQIDYAATESIKLLDQYITDTVEPKVKDADYFAETISKQNIQINEGSELRKRLEEYASIHPENASVFLGTTEGAMVQYPKKELPEGYDPRDRDWYKNAENKSNTVISDAYLSASGDHVVTISKKLKDGSGVIGINLTVDTINQVTREVNIGKEGYAALLGKEMNYISHPTIDPGTIAKEDFLKKIYVDDEGKFSYQYKDQDKKMVYLTNKLTGWKVMGTMYKNEIVQASDNLIKIIIVIEILTIMVGVSVAFYVTRLITKPLNDLKTSANIISQGNLTEAIKIKSQDEIGELGDAFQNMNENLRQLIIQVDENTEQVATASEELSAASEQTRAATEYVGASIQDIAFDAEKQTSAIDNTVLAIEEIAKGVKKISFNTESVNKQANNTAFHAEEGESFVKRNVEQMNTIYAHVNESDQMIQELNDRSSKINEIITVISQIAEQTNLLALNAAIEAARAGEQGKGFAVVADEVRKLAEQSQSSAKQITDLVQEIQLQTEQSAEKMNKAAKSVGTGIQISNDTIIKFNEILKGVKSIAPQIAEISTTVKVVSEEVSAVSSTTNELADIAKKNAAASDAVAASTQEQIASLEEVNASAKALADSSEELQGIIRRFTV
ncbi:methyl-accepting chemotaxis protein [Niallia sp. NCCP-28]|uniref:methyl-accepting chemotaxis protein n=1 Tax=Niallia sp. NCCP-28 TaxID=2934712 RepID=UPI002082943B|nr:methyl-accepting chemotaxis protein [Niallia sp. NCCP-28]GKU80742.1 methyl-accepting chemotaxis protein [Niallia sp. NCCP-28]